MCVCQKQPVIFYLATHTDLPENMDCVLEHLFIIKFFTSVYITPLCQIKSF